jgi:hypothetical protein
MHNAHVIYVCAASVLVGMFAACFAQHTLGGHGEAQISATFMFVRKHN